MNVHMYVGGYFKVVIMHDERGLESRVVASQAVV